MIKDTRSTRLTGFAQRHLTPQKIIMPALFGLMFGFAPMAQADSTKIIPIENFSKLFETLDKIPPENRTDIDIHATVKCADIDPTNLVFSHVQDSQKTSLITDRALGYLDMEAMRALPADAQLEVTARDDCSFSMTMTPKVPLGKTMSAPQLRKSLQQLRKAVVKIVPFVVRPLIPRSLEIGIELPAEASAKLIRNNGKIEALEHEPLKHGKSGVIVSTKMLKGAKSLEFSTEPLSIVDMGRGVNGKT